MPSAYPSVITSNEPHLDINALREYIASNINRLSAEDKFKLLNAIADNPEVDVRAVPILANIKFNM
uniref:Uncharacterized protein n=1 Tax=viral metagenome TaxID=1070528 RepID=A0A6C0BNR7_9ZZZZ